MIDLRNKYEKDIGEKKECEEYSELENDYKWNYLINRSIEPLFETC